MDESLGRPVPMASDVVIDEIGCHIRIGSATDHNDATAECYLTTVQGGRDTEEPWREFAETQQAGVATTVPHLWSCAQLKELATELGRRGPNGTVPNG